MAERGTSDIDRFLAEIDRLRKKAQGGPAPAPKAKPVVARPVVEAKPKPRPRLEMPPGATIPTVAMARPMSAEGPVVRAVPVAAPTVVTPPGSVRVEAPEATVRTVKAAGQNTGSRQQLSPFGRQLSAVLAGKQSLAMGVVLGEIFGPPKCRQG
jgi:hypothetical protein